MLKGLTDEVGSRQLYMSSLYEYLPLFEADPEGRRAATEVALCELMQSGVTTVCDLSAAREAVEALRRRPYQRADGTVARPRPRHDASEMGPHRQRHDESRHDDPRGLADLWPVEGGVGGVFGDHGEGPRRYRYHRQRIGAGRGHQYRHGAARGRLRPGGDDPTCGDGA